MTAGPVPGTGPSASASASLAQRKRQLVATELTEAALQLLALKGFDAVTVDEIATTAGVSKRTFFRYFASKEDVVVQFLADMGADMRAALAARPAGERPSEALLHAVSVPLTACGDHAERALPVVRLILRTPALLARFLEHQARWREELTAELGERLGLDPRTDLHPRLAAGMALAAFDAVLHRWSDGEHTGLTESAASTEDPGALIAEAFAVLAPALDRAAS
ncbi:MULTISPECIES: TetR family transcriptional regulator [unclassified Streptomyces]|uniref:TetR family transcriptional regulator n=1 Tax=unclassified Streptomyces TaxID=2593676 RepID=UPI0006F9EAC4|nr:MULTISPECIES: TetR family transcriptional regulator [unclassified Streptomyces]KQX49635.1 TetR family transcriptional regulator [Streptomyces sp. Root1304]KRA79252.1 TetR family transcriptional regulator [Streptomyces sp. Root66D1]